MTAHRDKFLLNETNRLTGLQFYWCYDFTCFGQPFHPSSGVLSLHRPLVNICRFDDLLLPGTGWNCSSILLLVANVHQICKNLPRADVRPEILMMGWKAARNM